MSGLLVHQLAGQLTPEELARQPYMRDSNPLMDLLIAYFQQTEGVQPFGRKGVGQPTPKPPSSVSERMRATAGPIKAETPKRIARERDKILRKADY